MFDFESNGVEHMEASVEPSDAKQGEKFLVPDRRVADEFSTSLMSLWRWDHDPELAELGWPQPVKLRNRNYRVRKALEDFKQALIRHSLKRRSA
jgi:hypothetical protein